MPTFRADKIRNYTVMSNHHLQNHSLSLKAKGLMSFMLSLPEDWDYTMTGLARLSSDGISAVRSCVRELEEHGYLKRRRVRDENGHFADTEYTIIEIPESLDNQENSPVCENRTLAENVEGAAESPICENPTLDKPILGNPPLENRTQQNTNIQKTKLTKDMIDAMRARVRENIEYDLLVYTIDRAALDEIVELIVEAACSGKDTVRIVKDEFPADYVRERLLTLDSEHIQYVLDCVEKSDKKIGNIKAYLLAALFNAPVTIGGYYTTTVNFDMNRRE